MIDLIIAEDSKLYKESFFQKNTVQTNVIYYMLVIIILISIVLLPIIKINLSVQGVGFIRPIKEKTEIKANKSEIISNVFTNEGQFVKKGDTILILRDDMVKSKIDLINQQIIEKSTFQKDLNNLISSNNLDILSDLYAQQYISYSRKIADYNTRLEQAEKELNRNKILYEKEIISTKKYEDLEFDVKQILKEKDIYRSNQLTQWETELVKYTNELNGYKEQLNQIRKEKEFYRILAPVSGTIEEFSGLYAGSIIHAGQTIAVISPQSDIIAEVYVSAKKIGYLSEGQKANIQVDAFNYNQWGWLNGEIINISDDFILADNTPVFNVKCKLNKDYLELKNGVKGKLKKGMTVNAQFMIARRSLFQLLYQKSDDWLNPSRSLVSQ